MKKIKITVSLILLLSGIAVAEEKLVAVGDGFKITQKHLADFIEYFKKEQHFVSSDQEYPKSLVRLWLFAKEAKALGLDKTTEVNIENEPIEKMIYFQRLYSNMLVETQPISELGIESYYWAHLDYFEDNTKTPPETLPLTPELKKKIRQKMAEAKRTELISKTAEDLMKKYHVKICDPQQEGCK